MKQKLIKEISKSMMTNVHSSTYNITPNKPIPVEEFLEEIENLNFYEHGGDRGNGWSAVTLYGMDEEKTDHPSKYGITKPILKWCLEEKAPLLTKYFKNNFFDGLKYKRIRIMRLDPNGVIRPHSDNYNNSLYNALNVELGPKTPKWSMLVKGSTQNLHLYPGRVYLFNNYFYHTVMNESDQYRYQIIVHLDHIENSLETLIRSNESYAKGVYINNSENIDSAIWWSTGKPRGTGCINLPYIKNTLQELKDNHRWGFFLSGNFKYKTYIDDDILLDAFEKWKKSNGQTIETNYFCFWNSKKPDPIKVKYEIRAYNDSNDYWTYTTDTFCEFVSPDSKNTQFDLIIGPSTGTNHEHLGVLFNCNNFLAYNYKHQSNIVHKEIRDFFRFKSEKEFNAWEEWEKRSELIGKTYMKDVHTTVEALSPTRRFFNNITPFDFIDKIYYGKYEYMIIDLVKNPEQLIPYVTDKRIIFNASNIYGYIDMLNHYSLNELKDSWDRLMNVFSKSKYTYFIGEDYYKVNKRLWI